MSTDATITLQNLQCLRQDRGPDGSHPYIWHALVAIDSTFKVNVLTPCNESRVIIQSGMKSGQTAGIPGTVGVQTCRFEGDLTGNHLVLVTALWEKRDTPDNVVSAGYTAFADSLQSGITANLPGLGSSDPATQQAAIEAIRVAVRRGVTDAISNSLTWYQKGEIWAGLMHLDTLIDNSSTAFSSLTPQSFTVSFGGSIGGRPLFPRDNTQNGAGAVDAPGIIGQGGWENFKFLFSGDNGIIHAPEPALTPANAYVIDANLQLNTVACEAETFAVNQDQVAVNSLEAQLRVLQMEFAQASASEKPDILAEIKEFEKEDLAPAQAKLAADTKALEAFRARSALPTSQKPAASVQTPAVSRVTVSA